jgi:sugar (pentulose or hexulose) kinase
MRLVAGIDCGSSFTKAVLVTQNGSAHSSILGKGRAKSGINMEEAARAALEAARAIASNALLSRIRRRVSRLL